MEFEKVREIIADVLSLREEEITPESRFIEDLGADSLDIFQIILGLEETFDITISDSDAEKISTVGDAVEEIKKAING